MVPPMPRARAASNRFCVAGMTDWAAPAPRAVAHTSTMAGAPPISSARRMAERRTLLPGGMSSGPAMPSSRRLAHHASRYSSPSRARLSASVTSRKRQGWALPPLGAWRAASRMSRRSARARGSGRKRRMARIEYSARPSVMVR